MGTFTYKGCELEERDCPHCGVRLEPWVGPPDSGWGVILTCNNNSCPYYCESQDGGILHVDEDIKMGCRYAENPDNGYKCFALAAPYR